MVLWVFCVVGSWYWQDHTQRRLLALYCFWFNDHCPGLMVPLNFEPQLVLKFLYVMVCCWMPAWMSVSRSYRRSTDW